MLYFITAVLVLLNLYSFVLFTVDKWKAKKQDWRISEAQLLKSGWIGGSLGGIMAMHLWRHKISKSSFYLRMYGILVLQLLIVALLFKYILV